MLTLNINSRFRNKTFIVAMLSSVVLLIKQLGFSDVIPANYNDVINTVLTILTMLGIIVDTSTPGVSDKAAAESTDTAAASDENKADVIVIEQENTLLKAQLAQIKSTFGTIAE